MLRRSDEIHDFQLTDDEFQALKDRLPDQVRNSLRRTGVTAQTMGFKRAAAALRAENEFLAAYQERMEREAKVAELEGDRSDLARLKQENLNLRDALEARESELARIRNNETRERAAGAIAVSGD